MTEKFSALFRLGLKYLYRYRRRYGFLFTALVFGFGIVTFITSTKDGMADNVYYSAQSHYAGDIVAVGYDPAAGAANHLGRDEISALLNAADRSGLHVIHAVQRSQFSEQGMIYYNGAAIRLKYILGVDWNGEAHLFDKMSFDGAAELPAGDDGVILSAPVAAELSARLGDSVVLEVANIQGQKNTGVFIIKGITEDSSIFGYYKAYISRNMLNSLIGFSEGDCSSLGFFLEEPGTAETSRLLLQDALSDRLQLGPLVRDREGLASALIQDAGKPGIKVYLITLPVYLSEIADLLGALNMVTYFLYAMMLLIILVSAAVTYRLILHERTKELGVMRAIGFYGGDLRRILLTEAFSLGFIALAVGFLFARFLSWLLSFASFSWMPSFEIFMKDGKLTALYLPVSALINALSVFLILFAAVWFPVFQSSKKPLPALLSGGAL